MRRRDFIALFGSTIIGRSALADAQEAAKPVIGLLGGSAAETFTARIKAFHEGLSAGGYVEDQNVSIDARWANGSYDKLPSLAADLVKRQVAVIAAFTTPAAQAATSKIPILFTTIGDPVQIGLVGSLSHPGGNVTGASMMDVEVGPKLLDLFHQLVPKAGTVGLLLNPANPNVAIITKSMQTAADTLGLKIRTMNAETEHDLAVVFSSLPDSRVDGLVIPRDAFLESESVQVAALAAKNSCPAISQDRAFAAAGGLASYMLDSLAAYHEVGVYAARILKGERPADLPVVRPTKFDFVINLQAAKKLGVTVLPSLLAIADEVIE